MARPAAPRSTVRASVATARLWYAEAGQGAVELALILPILVLIGMGLLDFGRVFYTYEALANAAREGARYCALHPGDTAGTRTRITGELGGRVTPDLTVTACQPATPHVPGDPVTVSVSASVDPLTPLIGAVVGDPIPVRAAATMSLWLQ